MAQKDEETYDSYQKDAFDNPPAGPMGVHRGARSVASRVTPYVIVVVASLLAGLLFWGVYSGELSNLKMPWSSSQSTTASDSSSSSSDSSSSDSSTTSGDASADASADSSDASADSSGDASANDANSDAASTEADQQTDANTNVNQTVNLNTEVRVVNATSINGYAQSKADVLTQAGYTTVSASNPTGNVPSQTVVWYQNETDRATAENVAQTLGISTVEQSDGLVTPIVVVLLD